MTRRSNNPFYINDETQEIVCVDIRYRVKLKKYQKAGKWGNIFTVQNVIMNI